MSKIINVSLTTVVLCLNQSLTFSAPNKIKHLEILHINASTLGFRGGIFL